VENIHARDPAMKAFAVPAMPKLTPSAIVAGSRRCYYAAREARKRKVLTGLDASTVDPCVINSWIVAFIGVSSTVILKTSARHIVQDRSMW